MLHNRCSVDICGYCKGAVGKGKIVNPDTDVAYEGLGDCEKKPTSCGDYITAAEDLAPVAKLLDELLASKVKELRKGEKTKGRKVKK